MKHIIPIMVILLMVSTSFVGVGNPVEELMVERDDNVNNNVNQPITLDNSLTEHIWPTQGYNKNHIGRSPYSTENNPGIEKWRFKAKYWTDGSPVIGADGTIYFGCGTGDAHLYAVCPNGTLKWKFEAERGIGEFGVSPAIAEDGTIYFGTMFGSYLQAVNPDGTAKWKKWTSDIDTSITIGTDGIIFFGHRQGIDARYPNNGTLKWRFKTGEVVQSTPAIDDNGIIYFGSHDTYVYALYPNSTLKWKFKTDSWVHGSPSIGTDGTVYVCSDDANLYAIYPDNGTLKWKVGIASGMRSSPSIDKEGNLYFGVNKNKVYSIHPNGTIRWSFNLSGYDSVWGSTAAISDDGTLYIGVSIDYDSLGGGEILALNLEGTVKWRKILCNSKLESSPVIGEDGSIYICASNELGYPDGPGHLHAFGPVDANVPPMPPSINGTTDGRIKEYYIYKVSSVDSDNNPVSFFIDWGDGTNSGWTSDYGPGVIVSLDHTWKREGNYTIKAKARDTFGAESDWAYLEVTMPHNYNNPFWWLNNLLDRFPLLQRLLEGLIR